MWYASLMANMETDPLYELRGDVATVLGWARLAKREAEEEDRTLEAIASRQEEILYRIDLALRDRYGIAFIGSKVPPLQ